MVGEPEEKRIEQTLGLMILVRNPPVREEDAGLDADDADLQRVLMQALVRRPFPWTGNEVGAVRRWFDESEADFAEQLYVSEDAPAEWENAGDSPAPMPHSMEFMIRTRVISELRHQGAIEDEEFEELSMHAHYGTRAQPVDQPGPVEIDGAELTDDEADD